MIICQLVDEQGVEHYIVEQRPFNRLSDLMFSVKCRYHDLEHLRRFDLEFVKMCDHNGTECKELMKLNDGIVHFNVKQA